MRRQYVMGNGAIALGALSAGVNLISGYPGTPSSEILETAAGVPHEGTYLEWSVNEKAAMEVAAAAAYCGARAMVTMKQVGLNVASDPLMSLAYVGVKGGMVVVSADDPGPISSQTEQDTRRFAEFARIPVFDPSSPEEAFEMAKEAFEWSERYGTPVLLRPTTRVDHAYASIEVPDSFRAKSFDGFERDPKKWVIFPRLSYVNHAKIEERNPKIGEDFSNSRFNSFTGNSGKAVAATGISCAYAKEYLKDRPDVRLIKVGTPYPLPEAFLLRALEGVDEILCLEELSPFLEESLLKLTGKYRLGIRVRGKLTGDVPPSGEN
ncbi:MAG: indolepyruvate ferredoxin oxidoreductase subunit alpha, partial [Clostridia bacterium]|nr:indolepyruvate ferredoxin oxidoreductase subunit alpha [Clostridia bacterium]